MVDHRPPQIINICAVEFLIQEINGMDRRRGISNYSHFSKSPYQPSSMDTEEDPDDDILEDIVARLVTLDTKLNVIGAALNKAFQKITPGDTFSTPPSLKGGGFGGAEAGQAPNP